jgi:hypothetical protein
MHSVVTVEGLPIVRTKGFFENNTTRSFYGSSRIDVYKRVGAVGGLVVRGHCETCFDAEGQKRSESGSAVPIVGICIWHNLRTQARHNIVKVWIQGMIDIIAGSRRYPHIHEATEI